MTKKILIILVALFVGFSTFAQYADLTTLTQKDEKIYTGGESHKVKMFTQKFKAAKPKNIILLIGDGMGVTQVFAGLTANKGQLYLENCRYIGFSKTASLTDYITDSAAGGTALSTGKKTYNGAIAVDSKQKPITTILEDAERNGLATGLVSTSAITHATAASFIAHQPSRNLYEEIAADFLKTDIDVFIGGGYKHFSERKDGRNLTKELENNGYTVLQDLKSIKKVKKGKLAGLTAYDHNGRIEERGDMLPVATKTAIKILSENQNGFFLMIEGSQIDWAGHEHSTSYIVEEMLDFDRTVGEALKFAAKDGETLVLVTSDHETGGMAVLNGNFETGMVHGEFTTTDHTGLMVPVFAYGPGAIDFIGFMENTDIHSKMKKLLFGN